MILVTGASGLLGAAIVLRACEIGKQVVAVSNRHLLRMPGVEACRVDLTDFPATRKIITTLRPASVIHCAAATNVDWCEDHVEQAHRINVCASSFLAELAREINARFVYVSTDSIFDGEKGNYSEVDRPGPLNVYARTKFAAEQDVVRIHQNSLVVRVNIYGWNAQDKQSLAEWIVTQLSAGKELAGFTDIYFAPILVNHLAEILLTMLDRRMSGLYHVTGSETISKYDFAKRVAVAFGFKPERVVAVRAQEAKLRAPRPRNTSLNTEKICKELGRPMPDIESGLRMFKALHEEQYVEQLKSYVSGAG
jgi:dTDP-4-dehydrorhamnose reductase